MTSKQKLKGAEKTIETKAGKIKTKVITPNIKRSAAQAFHAIQRLHNQQLKKIDRFLSQKSLKKKRVAVRKIRIDPRKEQQYRKAAKGHEKPYVRLRHARDARLFLRARGWYIKKRKKRKRGFFSRLWNGIKSAVSYAAKLIYVVVKVNVINPLLEIFSPSPKYKISQKVRKKCMTKEYLGKKIWKRFNNTPPVFIFEKKLSHLGPLFRLSRNAGGFYGTNTNLIFLLSEFKKKSTAIQMAVAAHEMLHYASWLGGGDNFRWRDEYGRPVLKKMAKWLNEGLTELHAIQLAEKHGFKPGSVAYYHEPGLAYFLQKIVGKDILKKAYLSGDFTKVRNKINTVLGKGAFKRIINSKRGIDALFYIRNKVGILTTDKWWVEFGMIFLKK
jgi:hypothetical protein